MDESGSTKQRGNLFLALVGMWIVPGFFLVDTLLAFWRGWGVISRANYGDFVVLGCVTLMLLSLIMFLLMVAIGPTRRALRRGSVGIVVFSVSILVGWFIGEGLLMLIHPQPGYHLRPAGTKYVFQPDPFTMTNVSGEAVTTINSQGVRGSEPPPRDEAYRILCVGGSTTEGYYLDDTETWTALLEERLGEEGDGDVWVGAAAVSEYATPQHLRFIEKSPLIDEVDCVVLMVGSNDFMRYLMGFDTSTAMPPLWYRSGLFGLIKEYWNASRGADQRTRGFVVDSTGEELDLHRLGMKIEEHEVPLDVPAAVEAFGERLTAICDAAKARGVRLVLVTQPVLWDDFLSEQGNRRLNIARVHPVERQWDYLTAANLGEAMSQYNEKVVEVAESTGTEYFDAALEMRGEVKYFYDDYHFNESGSSKFAELLSDWFAENSGSNQATEAAETGEASEPQRGN